MLDSNNQKRSNPIFLKNTKGKAEKFQALPFFYIFIILIFASCEKKQNNNSLSQTEPNYTKSSGIIYGLDPINYTIKINHTKIAGFKDNFEKTTTLFEIQKDVDLDIIQAGDSIDFKLNSDYLITDIIYLNKRSLPIYNNVIGVIKEVKEEEQKLLIDHEEIPGFMEKMIMNLNVHNSIDLNKFSEDDSISFSLFITDKNHFTSNYKKLGKSSSYDNTFWEEDENDPYLSKSIGDTLDNVFFLDLESNKVSLNDINSDLKLISLIFTRCPIPNMCPAVVANNQYLAYNFNDNVQFIIISFDYLYDRPEVLKKKYEDIQNGYSNIKFLSSYNNFNDLYKLTTQIDYGFWGIEENNIGHNNVIALIDKNNKILKYYSGFEIEVNDIKKDIQEIIKN